jgi:hypothetical protein
MSWNNKEEMVGDILKQILKGLQKLGLLVFLTSKANTLLSVVHQRFQRRGKTGTYPCRPQKLLSVVLPKARRTLLTNSFTCLVWISE